jgi:pyruvate/2-oxoglutarate dehydrogenase complex dihydrolipoamide dehydrogenase (E3) component
VLRAPFTSNDRARAEADTTGLVKIITSRRGLILGASIVGPDAGELIQPWVLALQRGLKIGAMAGPVLPYPTRGEAARRAAIGYYETLASSRLVRLVVALIKTVRP